MRHGGGFGQVVHPLLYRRQVLGVDVNLMAEHRLEGVEHLAVIAGLHLFEQVHLIVVAAVDQGGHIVCQLEGGKLVVLLPDGGVHGLTVIPGLPEEGGGIRPGHIAFGFGQLYAGVLPQAKQVGVLDQGGNPRAPAHVIEEDVARVLDGVGHILHPVVAAGAGVNPASGAHVGVIGVHAGTRHGGVGGDDAAVQSGNGGDHLKCGAGGKQAGGGVVYQRPVGVVKQVVVGLPVGGGVIGGIGGHGEHAPGHIHHHSGGLAWILQLLHELGQQILCHPLQADVKGEHHIAAGGWLQGFAGLFVCLPADIDDFARLVGFNLAYTAFAVEIILEGGFHPGTAHNGIHGVALVQIFLEALLGDAAHIAQDMGGVGGVVLPGGDGVNDHAGEGVLLHLGDEADVHILGEDIL